MHTTDNADYTTDNEEYALRYALEYGYPVIPIRHNRTPYIEGWNSGEAATTYAQVWRYWTKFPNADVGVLAGDESQLVVVDVDDRNSTTSVIKLIEDNTELTAETLVMAETTRGVHLYFSYDYAQPVPTQQDFLANSACAIPHVDFLSQGSLVLAPPSVSKAWMDGNSIFDNRVPQLPDVLLRLALENALRNPSACTSNGSLKPSTERIVNSREMIGDSMSINSIEDNQRRRLLATMQDPIPAGMSYQYFLDYGLLAFGLLHDAESRLANWYGLANGVVTPQKAQERLAQLKSYIDTQKRKLRQGTAFLPAFAYNPAKPSERLREELQRLLAGCSRSKIRRQRTVDVAAYLVMCAKATTNGRRFFRSYSNIISDNEKLFADVSDRARFSVVSKLIGLVVDGYLIDKATGEIRNYVPIFRCMAHGETYREGHSRSCKAGEYMITDEYTYLLEL